jgi:hypothetical protein
MEFFEESWVPLHAPKLGHGTDCFTSPPKEGILWIFPAGKIRRPFFSVGSEPAILGTRGQHANHQTTDAAGFDPRTVQP